MGMTKVEREEWYQEDQINLREKQEDMMIGHSREVKDFWHDKYTVDAQPGYGARYSLSLSLLLDAS